MRKLTRQTQASPTTGARSRMGLSRTELLLLGALVAATALVSSHLLPQPAHAVLAVLVLLVVPASALQRYMRISDPIAAWVVPTAFALSLVVALATLLLYLEAWSQTALLTAVACVSIALVVASAGART